MGLSACRTGYNKTTDPAVLTIEWFVVLLVYGYR